eukprot:257680-Pelagomonas_calceolata.AAC.2
MYLSCEWSTREAACPLAAAQVPLFTWLRLSAITTSNCEGRTAQLYVTTRAEPNAQRATLQREHNSALDDAICHRAQCVTTKVV